LIVCGYGFGDKGINTYVADWISAPLDRRIIVIHPEPDKLRDTARGAIRNKWDDLKNLGRLQCIPKKIEELSWREVRGELSNA
jgi:hypothetical protein